MTKLMLVLVATMFVSVASFAQEGAAPAPTTPGVESAPADAGHKDMTKKEKKAKKAKKAAKKGM